MTAMGTRTKSRWAGLIIAWVALSALAAPAFTAPAFAGGGPRAVRDQVELSTVATGTVDITPEGRVAAFTLDRKEALPQAAVELIERKLPGWAFRPVLRDGQATRVSARMSLRLIAKKQAGDNFLVRIAGANFGDSLPEEERIRSKDVPPPAYPAAAARAGVGGTVFVVARLGRDGKVEDAFAEQINLRGVASEQVMKSWRDLFGKAAIAGARAWVFRLPAKGRYADRDHVQVRVPVDFIAGNRLPPRYGEWEAYVPGPRQKAPWPDAEGIVAGSADAVGFGGVEAVGSDIHLATPLSGG